MELNQILLWDQVMGNLEDAEEDLDIVREVLPKRDPFQLSENKFVKLFRINKQMCRELVETVAPFIQEQTRASALTVQTKVLAALRFFASGSYQEVTGSNHYVAVSQASMSRCIQEVTDALNRPAIMNRWISFPRNMVEMQNLRTRFFEKHQFPGIIGCIDCTHISIVAPPTNDLNFPEHVYVNRKSYHSLNVQLICDPDLRIMNVNARFPGSTHDAHIWNQSAVSGIMERMYRSDPRNIFFLIGDSGYPSRPWLLTPIRDPRTPREERFNNRFCSIRTTIERCNGVLKNRFRCLLRHRALHYSPIRAAKIVNSCVILHNMCIDNGVEAPDPEDNIENIDYGIYAIHNHEDDGIRGVNPDLAAARQLQRNIINNHVLNRQ